MSTRRKLLALMVALVSMSMTSFACTNFLITKGASKDGSTMITYAADSHTLYGELYYNRAARYPAGTMLQVIDWDSGSGKYLHNRRQHEPVGTIHSRDDLRR